MKLEVGKKYTDGRDVVEIKFIDWEGSGWGLTDERKSCRYIKTYDTAWTEVIDKPDPGEGWRLLGPDEDLESGDQYYLRFSDPFENWATVKCSDLKQTPGMYYRRRIAPQYVPYTWEDREELRGRWYRNKETKLEAMVYYFSPLGSDFRINSYCPEMFLELCDWLDGSPCGKKVV
jgi:hypothetical protein